MNVRDFISEVEQLEMWLDDRNSGDLPIEIFDKRGNKVEFLKFSIDLSRNVIEIHD